MKTFRYSMLLLVICALMASMFGLAAVRPTRAAEASPLAAYAPPDTVLFATMRTDDAFITDLDSLLAKVVEKLPPELQQQIPPNVRLRILLTTLVLGVGYDYATDIRPILGDQLALFVGNLDVLTDAESANDSDVPIAVVAEIKDRAKAVTFVENLLDRDPTVKEAIIKGEEATYTVFRSKSPSIPLAIAINDNALIIGTGAAIDAATATKAKLFEQAIYTDVLAMLPESTYNISVYIDLKRIVQAGLKSAEARNNLDSASSPFTPDQISKAVEVLGPVAFGATILDDTTLTIDYAQKLGDLGALKVLGLTNLANLLPKFGRANPDFVSVLPAKTSAYIHGTNLKAQITAQFSVLQEVAAANPNPAGQPSFQQQLDDARAQVKAQLGLDLDADILSWLDGDYAVFMRYDATPTQISFVNRAAYPDRAVDDVFDIGFVVEAKDPAKANKIIAALGPALKKANEDPNTKVETGKVAGFDAVLINTEFDTPGLSGRPAKTPIQFVIATNNKVFVIATRTAAEQILKGEGGLDKDPVHQAATKFFVPEASLVLYGNRDMFNWFGDIGSIAGVAQAAMTPNIVSELNGTPAPTLSPAAQTDQVKQTQQQLLALQTVVRQVTTIFEHTTGTLVQVGDKGDQISRFTITLTK